MDQLENTVTELKKLMQDEPTLVDKKLIQEGKNTLAVYFDQNFGANLDNYQNLKIKLIRAALLDLMSGGFLLKTRKMGLVFRENKFFEFNLPYSEPQPKGQVVASISLKVLRAFDGYRTKTEDEQALTDENKNAAVYYLIYLLSKDE